MVVTGFLLHKAANPITVMAIAIPISLLVAEIFYKLVEKPAHGLAKRVAAEVIKRQRATTTTPAST